MDELVKRSVNLTILLVAITSVILILAQKLRWSTGLLVATAWSIINFTLIINLLKIAILQKSKAKLTLLLLVKFPVLYLLGFFILISGFFPVSSLLVGLISILVVMGALKIWPKQA